MLFAPHFNAAAGPFEPVSYARKADTGTLDIFNVSGCKQEACATFGIRAVSSAVPSGAGGCRSVVVGSGRGPRRLQTANRRDESPAGMPKLRGLQALFLEDCGKQTFQVGSLRKSDGVIRGVGGSFGDPEFAAALHCRSFDGLKEKLGGHASGT